MKLPALAAGLPPEELLPGTWHEDSDRLLHGNPTCTDEITGSAPGSVDDEYCPECWEDGLAPPKRERLDAAKTLRWCRRRWQELAEEPAEHLSDVLLVLEELERLPGEIPEAGRLARAVKMRIAAQQEQWNGEGTYLHLKNPTEQTWHLRAKILKTIPRWWQIQLDTPGMLLLGPREALEEIEGAIRTSLLQDGAAENAPHHPGDEARHDILSALLTDGVALPAALEASRNL